MKGEKISFPVTPKDRQEGIFLHLIIPQLTIIVLTILGVAFAWWSYYNTSSAHTLDGVLLNTFWAANNVLALSGIFFAAIWKPEPNSEQAPKAAAA